MPSPTNGSTYTPNSDSSKPSSFIDALAAKPMVLVSLILAVIVVAAVVVGVRSQRASRAQAANGALYEAQKSLETEMKAFASAVTPAPTDKKAEAPAPSPEAVQFKKVDVDAKFPESVKKFKGVISAFSGTRAAFEAELALGSLYNDHGDAAKAAPWFQQAADDAPTSYDRALSYASLGYALEGGGKYADAIQANQKAIGLSDSVQAPKGPTGQPAPNSFKADLLLSVARNQELMGDKAKARETYDQIVKEMPSSEQARTATLLKSQLH